MRVCFIEEAPGFDWISKAEAAVTEDGINLRQLIVGYAKEIAAQGRSSAPPHYVVWLGGERYIYCPQ